MKINYVDRLGEMKICLKEQGYFETWDNTIMFNLDDFIFISGIVDSEDEK